jgi:hypothetical protein
MATGRLGAIDLTSTSATEAYACPATTFSVVSVNICNRTASAVTVSLALATTTSPANGEYLEYQTSVSANGVLERTGIVMDAAKKIVVTAGTANALSVVVYGIETATA